METPNIREALPKDLESLKKTLSSLSPNIEKITQEEWSNYLQQTVTNPLHQIFVAEYDGEIIGTVTCVITPHLIPNNCMVAEIKDAATSKEHMGKGIGTLLMEHCIMYAREKNVTKMVLTCENDAVNFYKKLHFKKTNRYTMERHL